MRHNVYEARGVPAVILGSSAPTTMLNTTDFGVSDDILLLKQYLGTQGGGEVIYNTCMNE